MESRLVTSLWKVRGHKSALELKVESSGTHLYTSKKGELTALRSPVGSPHPNPGAARSYSMLPMNTAASEEVETRKKPWKGITAPSLAMKSTWRMENMMSPLLPESLSLAWEKEWTISVGQVRDPSIPSRNLRLG